MFSNSRNKKRPADAESDRNVVIYIKTSDKYNYDPAKGDRMTQIALVEMVDGELTKNSFSAFVKPEDPALVAACEKHYRDNLKKEQADELIGKLRCARSFREVQADVLAFLGDPTKTRITVHNIKHVLDFMRNELDEAGKNKFAEFRPNMKDIISKAAELSKLGLYHAGDYPDKIDTNKEVFEGKRSYYNLDFIIFETKVPGLRNRDKYDAKSDAVFVAKADQNCAKLLESSKKQAVAEVAERPRPGK